MDWILFLSLFSIHNLVFLSICMLRKRSCADANKSIFYILLVFAEIIAFNTLIYRRLLLSYSFLIPIHYILIFSCPPNFLAIINSLFNQEKKTDEKKKLINFLPSSFFVFFFFWYYLQPPDFPNLFFEQLNTAHKPWQMITLEFIFFLQIVIYISICYQKIYRFAKTNPDNDNGKRLWRFINFVVVVIVFIYVFVFISFFSVITTLLCCSVSSIAFYDLFSYESIINRSILTDKALITQSDTLTPVQHLSEEIRQKITVAITQVMEEKKYFQNSAISLNSLADQCNTPKYLLSQYLSQYHGNFYDFINRYRIEEAKKLLVSSDSAKYNVEVIAQKCGFKTRSVFYTAFKKYTGVTPIQFIKNSKLGKDIE